MIIKEVNASVLTTPCKHIAHGVNCQNKMGSGIAKVLFEEYPQVKSSYHEFCSAMPLHRRLGEVQPVDCGGLTAYNCFTQFNYGYGGNKYVSYEAIIKCFKTLNMYLKGQELAIPRIGCGLAGGNWTVVSALINEVTPDISIYTYYV